MEGLLDSTMLERRELVSEAARLGIGRRCQLGVRTK
jgi:hypothetical protein